MSPSPADDEPQTEDPHGGDPPAFDPFPVESSERIYDSHWCALRRDFLRLDSGKLQEYHVFEVADAVAVVPVLPDGSLVLIWQLRHPHGKTHWEVPAGRIHDGETARDAARRELLEETGYAPGELADLPGFYPTNGISAHYAHVVRATNCVKVAEPTPEDSEKLVVRVFPEPEVRRRLLAGDFADAFTALPLMYYFGRRDG